MPDVSTETPTTSTETPPESTPDALTPEARDAQTFAKYGMNPDGSPIKVATPAPDPTASDPAPDPEGDTPATPDPEGTADADADSTEGEDTEVEITDEDFDRVVDAVLELNADKLAKNPRLRESIEKEIREELEAKYEAQRRSTTADQDRTVLIRQGREAVDRIVTTANKIQAEFAKAKAGEDFDESSFDLNALGTDLKSYGAAAVADSRRSYDEAFSTGFRAAAKVGGEITEAERDAIVQIVNSANRMELDEKQGDERFDAAKNHLYTEMWTLMAKRAFDAGKAAALTEAKARREASKRILDADAVLAGAAKEAKLRGKLPPSPTVGTGETASNAAPTMEAYQAAKRAGNRELADRILVDMAAAKPQTPQRRG